MKLGLSLICLLSALAVTGCSASSSGDGALTTSVETPSADTSTPTDSESTPAPTPTPSSPSVAFTSQDGFQLSMTVAGSEAPTCNGGSHVAPPGFVCLVAAVTVTNETSDRPATFGAATPNSNNYFYPGGTTFVYAAASAPSGISPDPNASPTPGVPAGSLADQTALCTNQDDTIGDCQQSPPQYTIAPNDSVTYYMILWDVPQTAPLSAYKVAIGTGNADTYVPLG